MIYASDLITVNSAIKRSISVTCEDSVHHDYYFYCTKPSGEVFLDYMRSTITKYSGVAYVYLYRYENGTWTQKYTASFVKDSGNIPAETTMTVNSYGEGAYKLVLYGDGGVFYDLVFTVNIYPCTTSIVRGDYLTCCSDAPVSDTHTESSIIAMVLRARGTYLTQDLIDEGALYTTPQ